MGALHEVMLLAKERQQGWCEPAVLTVDERGMIRDCSRAGEEFFGYSLRELLMLHISGLLPQLSGIELLPNGRVNTELVHLCESGHVFWAQNRSGDVFPSELSLVRLEQTGARMLRIFVVYSEQSQWRQTRLMPCLTH